MHTYCSKHKANFYSNMRKLTMEPKKKGFNYFNKTSKQSKLRIKFIDISRCYFPVTDFVKSSKDLQHSNTPIENLASEMEVKLKL